MSYGFDYKKYYIVRRISINHTSIIHCEEFITNPDTENSRALEYKETIHKEAKKIEKESGAKLCHVCFYKKSLPFRFILIFDLGVYDNNIYNIMKLKAPSIVQNDIRPADDDYINDHLKKDYENAARYNHDGYTAYIT